METVINIQEKKREHAQIAAIDRVFDAQQKAYGQNPNPTAEERINNLKSLKNALLKYQEPIVAAIHEDFGTRSRDESILAEIFPSVEGIRYAIKNVKKWMKPSRRKVGLLFQPARAKVFYQPLGVVGIIAPWNYPVYLTIGPLIGALAAGNRVMIKMSEFTPRIAEVIREMLGEIFDEDRVAVITGEADVGAAFSAKAWDHLLFTGSTTVGRHVMRAASDNLTPVTLELGGKSPAIISRFVPMKDAAERIAFGKVFNVGQTCVAPDYVLCPRNRQNEFVEAFREAVAGMYAKMAENSQYTSVVNERQYERLQGLLADAEEKGARVISVNPGEEDFSNSRKMPIQLILDGNDKMKVLQDEIFGPILPVVLYDSLRDAVAYVNSHPRPLALYFFDYDKEKADYVITHTHSGGVIINDTLAHVAQDDMPFGGVGASGMGQYHGPEGFLTFSKAKGVLFKPRFNSTKLIYPPYGRWVHKLIYWLFLR